MLRNLARPVQMTGKLQLQKVELELICTKKLDLSVKSSIVKTLKTNSLVIDWAGHIHFLHDSFMR